MELEKIMLSEIGQAQKDKYCISYSNKKILSYRKTMLSETMECEWKKKNGGQKGTNFLSE